MIGAPNSLNLNCKVRVMKEAPGPSVSEEIADIFTNYNIDYYRPLKPAQSPLMILSLPPNHTPCLSLSFYSRRRLHSYPQWTISLQISLNWFHLHSLTASLEDTHYIQPLHNNGKDTVTTCKAGISLGVCPTNERRRYNVTTSLIGWAHT